MNIPVKRQSSPWRYLWLIALIALPALGWYGILDELSSNDINNSLTNAGLIYGTARGINALVSVLQGTELNVLVMTFTIGEVLDPINDLVERFSDIVFLALGSLALQKILLALVSQKLFNILLTIIAFGAGVSFFIGKPNVVSLMLRLFILAAFFRFSLGLVVLANNWVDATFLEEADQQRHRAMEKFQGELRTIDALSQKADEAAALLSKEQAELEKLQADRGAMQESLQTIATTISDLEKQLTQGSKKDGNICALSIRTPVLSPTCSASVKKLSDLLEDKRLIEDGYQIQLEALSTVIEDTEDKITCLKKRASGEHCEVWRVLPEIPSVAEIRSKLNDMGDRVSDFAETIINLLVSLLLKSIAVPLLFFYLLLKVVRVSWEKL